MIRRHGNMAEMDNVKQSKYQRHPPKLNSRRYQNHV